MITPMYKVAVIGTAVTREIFIQDVAQTGLLHIVQSKESEVDREAIQSKIDELKNILSYIPDTDNQVDISKHKVYKTLKNLKSLIHEKTELDAELQKTLLEIEKLHHFGNCSESLISKLSESGAKVHLLEIPKAQEKQLEGAYIFECERSDKLIYAILILISNDNSDLKKYEVPLPPQSLSFYTENQIRIKDRMDDVSLKIESLSSTKKSLHHLLNVYQSKLTLIKSTESIRTDNTLQILEGWCPQNSYLSLEEKLTGKGYGIVYFEPDEMDYPPIKLSNPKWIECCKPLYKLINSFPGYKEQDISFSFLIFTSLFFAILIGDAGYGVLGLAITGVFSIKSKNSKYEHLLKLGWVFSVSTIIWGSITGNWFGLEPFSKLPLIRDLIVPQLNAFESQSQNTVILICFVIGAFHISVAHLLKSLTLSKEQALAELGWIGVIWSVFFVVKNLVLEDLIPAALPYILLPSLILITLFSCPGKSIFKRIGFGLAAIPMKLMNCFADTISYIRLFAVGMATLAVAKSFNEIALGIGFDSITNAAMAVSILLLGHGVNIAMAALSVVVHGLRLNMLEFSSHLGLEWSGEEYQPLSSIQGD